MRPPQPGARKRGKRVALALGGLGARISTVLNRYSLIRGAAAAALMVFLVTGVPSTVHAADPPPNIVIILADDLGINDLGCYGRTGHQTPNLDRLAAQGLRFTNAYAAAPLCSASRAALLTGKHPARLHLTSYLPGRADSPAQRLRQPRQEGQLPLEEVTLAEALQPAGYISACHGKWHLGSSGFGPGAQGFSIAKAGPVNAAPDSDSGAKGEAALSSEAADFIAAHRESPFLLLLAHDSPHIPFTATDAAKARHTNAFNPTYAAVLESLDASVGTVLQALESHGLAGRTLVIFTSDNGGLHVPELGLDPPTHNTPYRAGKGFLFDGGLRVPLIVRWPGATPAGAVSTQPVILTDIMPTVMRAAGLDPARASGPLDGVSQLDAFRAPPASDAPIRPLYWHFPHYSNQGGRPASALRDGPWKLIESFDPPLTSLYNLQDDPGETTDLSAAHPEKTAELARQLAGWRTRVGAQELRENPEFDEAAATALALSGDVSSPPPAGSDPAGTAAALGRKWAAWRAAMDAAVAGRKPATTPATGDVRLHARDAKTHGSKLRYEPEPWKNTLGYWVEAGDWAEWEFSLPAAGRYEIEILQGCGTGNGGSEVEVRLGDQPLTFTVRETGHFQNFIPVTIGELDLKEGRHTLTLRPIRKARDAVMDVRRIVLRPAATTPAIHE